jgi:hypothetical protein
MLYCLGRLIKKALVKPFVSREKRYNSRLKKRLTAQSLKLIRLFFRGLVWFAQNKQVQKALVYLSVSILVVYMLLWNWKIVLATSIGIAIMIVIHTLQTSDLAAYWHLARGFLSGSNRKLAIAVLGGGLASLTTYLAACIWSDLENRWVATGSILQGLGTLVIMGLLSWHILLQNNRSDEIKVEKYLEDLAHPDPLKRLIALRFLAKCQNLNYPLIDYYRLMLTQETQPIVKEALLDILAQSEQPLKIPLKVTEKIFS